MNNHDARGKRPFPPRFAEGLLKRLVWEDDAESVAENMREEFVWRASCSGRASARIWYGFHLFRSLTPFLLYNGIWSIIMFKNYLKTAFRNMGRQKGYSFINILGLAVALAGCLLIAVYIQFEFGFDKYHQKGDDIYRIVMHQPGNLYNGTEWWVVSPYVLKSTFKAELPELVNLTQFLPAEEVVSNGDVVFVESRFYYADPAFLEMFTFPLIRGDAKTALLKPFSLVLTQSMAKKYFGDEDPMGKTLTIKGEHDFLITGLMKDVPPNSHFTFDCLGSYETLHALWASRGSRWKTGWLNNPFKTYIQLRPEVDLSAFDEKLKNYPVEGFGDATYWFHVQPLHDIHFHGNMNCEIETNGDQRQVMIFGAVALFLLLIAGFNFINLSTARSLTRAREVGVRKVVGAHRRQLTRQFLGESLALAFIALLMAGFLAHLFFHGFTQLIGSPVPRSLLLTPLMIVVGLGLTLVTGFLAGLYPALLLSAFRPALILKGADGREGVRGAAFRNGLVTFQFVISIGLIICTVLASRQLRFMQTKDLGYESSHVITLNHNQPGMREELLQHPGVLAVAASSSFPNTTGNSNMPNWEGQPEGDDPFFYRLSVDEHFLDLYGIEVIQGRSFTEGRDADVNHAYLLNEAAVKRIGWDNPLGKRFGFWDQTGEVVGVVKDYHYQSLHRTIWPLGIGFKDLYMSKLSIRIDSQNIPATLKHVESVWNRHARFTPFQYAFLDEVLDGLYKKEQRLARGVQVFAGLAVFVACLGLLGLASFSVQRRVKEVGIRKVLGASAGGLVLLLSRDLARWVVLANVAAWPLAWLIMGRWLESFAYHIAMKPWVFILSGAGALVIAGATVGWQAVRAAGRNPVESLRYE